MEQTANVIKANTRVPENHGQTVSSEFCHGGQGFYYYNFTATTVYVKPSMGLPMAIPPSDTLNLSKQPDSSNYLGNFVIRYSIVCSTTTKAQILESTQRLIDETQARNELLPILSCIQESSSYGASYTIAIDYVISPKDFEVLDLGEGISLGLFQTVLSRHSSILQTGHPAFGATELKDNLKESAADRDYSPGTKPSASIDIYLVEEPYNLSRKFITIMDKVVELRPVSSTSLERGIYMVGRFAKGGNRLSEPESILVEPLEYVKEEHGFYDSVLDAERGTDTKLIGQRLERENIFHKHTRDREADERKAENEKRTFKQRSIMDTLKLMAVVIPLATTVIKGATSVIKGLRTLAAAAAAASAAGAATKAAFRFMT